MRHTQFWTFQGVSHTERSWSSAKAAQQEIGELTNLAAGLLAFERIYTATHGERTPVFRLLSMINEAIAASQAHIEEYLALGAKAERTSGVELNDIPF